MECRDKCRTGMVRLNATIPDGPQYAAGHTQLNIWGTLIFRGKCEIGSGNKINVGEGAVLDMGDDTKISTFCNVTAYSEIHIGAHSRIAHRCQIFDTNFHFIANFNHGTIKKPAHPISIGNYCWICNSTTITGGVLIPNKIIVASNSLVGKDMSTIPTESVIGGVPAKLISTGQRRVENKRFCAELWSFFSKNKDLDFFEIGKEANHSICDACQ